MKIMIIEHQESSPSSIVSYLLPHHWVGADSTWAFCLFYMTREYLVVNFIHHSSDLCIVNRKFELCCSCYYPFSFLMPLRSFGFTYCCGCCMINYLVYDDKLWFNMKLCEYIFYKTRADHRRQKRLRRCLECVVNYEKFHIQPNENKSIKKFQTKKFPHISPTPEKSSLSHLSIRSMNNSNENIRKIDIFTIKKDENYLVKIIIFIAAAKIVKSEQKISSWVPHTRFVDVKWTSIWLVHIVYVVEGSEESIKK